MEIRKHLVQYFAIKIDNFRFEKESKKEIPLCCRICEKIIDA